MTTSTEITWTKSTNGWGSTEYRATINGVRVLAHKTGGRFLSWELTTDTWPGKRITTAGTLRSLRELAESSVARYLDREARS